MAKRKLHTLDLATKIRLIEEIEKGHQKKKKIAEDFGIPNSTLSSIWAEREKLRIRHGCANIKGQVKRHKVCEYESVDKAVFKWFESMRGNSLPVSGPILEKQVLEYAGSLGFPNFKASDGWLTRFKSRHSILGKVLSGESASVDKTKVDEWKQQIPEVARGFKPDDIFNVDETGLFFKCLPTCTLAFKGEKCFGGKHSKERVTCLVGSNMTGSEKLKLLIIGKSKNPRCFNKIKSLPVDYVANQRSWMTADLFTNWLLQLDAKFGRSKRKVLFIIDNCPAHPKQVKDKLKFIKLEYFPPNMTSIVQPMDMGIIQNLKVHYKRRILTTILKVWETKKEDYKITLLDCVREVSRAWIQDVTPLTIENCFKKAGFKDDTWDDEDDVPLNQLICVTDDANQIERIWNRLTEADYNIEGLNWRDYVEVHDGIVATEIPERESILESVIINHAAAANDDDSGAEDEEVEFETINIEVPEKNEIDNAIGTLQSAIEMTENVPDEVQHCLFKIESFFKRVNTPANQKLQIFLINFVETVI